MQAVHNRLVAANAAASRREVMVRLAMRGLCRGRECGRRAHNSGEGRHAAKNPTPPSLLAHPTMLRSSTPVRLFSAAAAIVFVLSACARTATPTPPRYRSRTRAITVTTVPLLVKEQRSTFPFLAAAFAKGGALDGKEV